jgi:hypothetical protein
VPQAKGKLIIARANRAKSQQGLASAEQQLLAGRTQRSRLKQHFSQSSQIILESIPDVAWTWDQVQQLCAAMPVNSSIVPRPAGPQQCMTQTAGRSVSPYVVAAEVAAEYRGQVDDASCCLETALLLFHCGSASELVNFVKTQTRAAESLKDATSAL